MPIRENRIHHGSRISALVFGAFLTACVSSPPPDQMSRSTVETAPADLQLLCASAVGKQNGMDSSKVLPVGSRKLDSKNYQVDLNAGGKQTSCIIDQDGKVTSIQPI